MALLEAFKQVKLSGQMPPSAPSALGPLKEGRKAYLSTRSTTCNLRIPYLNTISQILIPALPANLQRAMLVRAWFLSQVTLQDTSGRPKSNHATDVIER